MLYKQNKISYKQTLILELENNRIDREKKIAELEARVLALEKEREEVVDTRKLLTQYWEYTEDIIGVKNMGEIDLLLLQKAVGSRFSGTDDPVGKIKEVCSFWQNKISNGDWQPFKMPEGEVDEEKKIIDPEDGYVKMLRIHLGDETCEVVISALKEMNEYSPIKRSPVAELWNVLVKRKARLNEAIHCANANYESERKRLKAANPGIE